MGVAKVTLNGETQIDVTQKTVEASKMLSGITALRNDGESITGSIASKSSSDLTASGATVTAPAGYYASSATKTINSGAVTPSTSNTGLSTYFTSGTSSNKDVTITPQYTNTAGYIAAHSTAQSGTPAYYKIITATPAFDGGDLTGSSTAVGTNVNLSSTDNGIKIQTQYTANRAAVLYNGAVSGWVSKSDNAQALAAGGLSSTNGNAYYVTAVTVPVDVAFTVTTNSDTTYDNTSTLTISTGSYRRTSVTNSGSMTITNNSMGTVAVSNNGTTTVDSVSKTAGDVTIGAYADSSATTLTYSPIVQNGKWNTLNATGPNTYFGRVIIPAGTVTAPSTISSGSATVSTGTNTLTLTRTVKVTPSVTTAGYISGGTIGDSSVSLTASVTTQGATTYNTSSSDQTIASGTYLTGTQTIRKVTTNGIDAANIKDGTVVQVGDAGSAGRIANVTGTFTDASTVSSGQTAATAARILSGYSAWVDGAEVKGNIATITMPTSASSSATSGHTSKATISRSTSDQYINIPAGYNASNVYYKVNAVANGSAAAPATISGSSATLNVGSNNTISLSKTVSVTPVVSAGYVSSGTATNSTVSLTANVTTKAATTYYPSGSDQTVAAATYVTGAQTFKAVKLTNLSAANIAEGVVVKVGDADDDDRIVSITGTHGGAVPPTLLTKTVTANGTYNASDDSADGYSSVVVNVPTGTFADNVTTLDTGGEYHAITGIQVGGTKTITTSGIHDVANYAFANVDISGGSASKKQINFIDYNGTIVESYTKSEWQSVTTLPENPSHSGLTAQGWNWTKAQIDAQLTAMPNADIWVGQMYITTSGDTEIDVIFADSARLSPILTIAVNGTVTVDWGDGTTADTVTGTSLTTRQAVSHTYASVGSYTMLIHVVSGAFQFYGSSAYALLRKNTSGDENRVYANCVQAVRFGSGVTSIGSSAFYNCLSLTSVTIPSNVTSISSSAFNNCYSLASITIPSDVTSLGTSVFNYCYSLASITIPNGVTSISTNMLYNCLSLASITIPSGVTSIGSSAFSYCYSLTSITIPSGVTSIGSSAFSYCHSLTSITIPSGVTSIGTSTFSNCCGMAKYHILPTAVPTGGTTMFNNIASDCVIYVPAASLNAYKTAANWSTYADYMVGE